MINLIAPINKLGYGTTGLNIAKALNKQTQVALWLIGQPEITNQEDANLVQLLINNSRKPDFHAPCIRLWHQHDMTQFVGKGEKIGFPIFELDRFNDLQRCHLSWLDKIFVCSEWAKRVVCDDIDIKKENVRVIPLGVDEHIFTLKGVDKQQNHGTIFFNCGKWEVRKGHDILCKAFNKAFTRNDNVELWMMCDNPFFDEEETRHWKNLYKNSAMGDKVRFVDRVESSHEVYSIMSQVDCGVFPSRAEGWNLEALEMMACGKHVIITDYSGHTEFCTKDNAYLVSINKKEKAFDGRWFDGNSGCWGNIGNEQIEQIINYMREIHKKKTESSLTVNTEGITTAKEFSWHNSATEILKNV